MLDPPNVTTRQLQEQLTALQTELNLAKQTRDELAEELLKVAAESSNTEKHEEKINALKEEYGNLHSRHLTCLELLGEKTEQVEDLKQTINEMRALFHNDLLLKLST
ncbi:TATA element modulatory factor 1 TATA binding protein [Zopfochytrium polystomum]|nr:TATA element modulatory factor 1 TATA binding protein [Zopfochytrium polystomum]